MTISHVRVGFIICAVVPRLYLRFAKSFDRNALHKGNQTLHHWRCETKLSDRRNNGLSRLIRRVPSVFCSIVFILMNVYTNDLFITNIQTATPNVFHSVCCSTSIEQSFKFSECLKIAHARMNFVCSWSHESRGSVDCSNSA